MNTLPSDALAIISSWIPFEEATRWPSVEEAARTAAMWAGVVVAAWLANFLTKKIIVRAVRALIERSKAKWDDVFVEHKVFQKLSHVAPALVFYGAAPFLFKDNETYVELVRRFANVWLILAAARTASALLDSLVSLGKRFDATRDKPIRSYVQVVKLVLFVLVSILVIATLMQKSPWALLTGLGAMTAILLLVFKDSILGFVASIQLASNDMVRVGDWIAMPRYGADGDVIEIGLHTVKVQNWDKTVSTIPTPAFMNDSFKNWRGMTESGGRRMKRSLAIDMSSVRFMDEADLERLGRVQLLREYLAERRGEVESWNREQGTDLSNPANGRRLTNFGTLRVYLQKYLEANPHIRKDMTFLVRQLPPGPEGIPIELYVFSSEQRWVQYESIFGDIFDHLLAVLPEFGLRAYQRPSGADFAGLRT